MEHPNVIIIAGPNGAGKSTAAPDLLKGALAVNEFVNADVIARGLSAFDVEKVAIQAGRIMLQRLDELAAEHVSFAFETTLASRTFAPWISKLKTTGYIFHLIYLWLPTPNLAISRVQHRVGQQGHFVPDDVVKRRYARGLKNYFQLYLPLANTWRMYNGSNVTGPALIARGEMNGEAQILDPGLWTSIETEARHGT